VRIGIIAALSGELKPLVRGWEPLPAARASGIRMWERPAAKGRNEVLAVCGGMGAAAVRRAFAAAEFRGAMDLVLSVGWAGALSPDLKPGEVLEANELIDAQTGERFRAANGTVRLVTTVRVAGPAEKARLHRSYGAAVVDMEATTIARLAQMRGISVRCLKGISDGVQTDLPDLNPFIDIAGQMQIVKFLAHVALRPGTWLPLARLGKYSATAAKLLAVTIEGVLAELED